MRTITQRAVLGVLAGAEKRFLVGVGGPSQWREVGAFVRAVAEGLVLRLAARTPIVGFACFDLDWEWSFTSNVGCGHSLGS